MESEDAKDRGSSPKDNVEEEFPFPLTDIDRHQLSINDDEFQPHTWEELKQTIGRTYFEHEPVL